MVIIINANDKIAMLERLICNEVRSYNKRLKENNVGIIDIDYSLIRYLCKQLDLKEININNSGYPTIKRKNNTVTTLSRFILEYYAKYDSELKNILENKEYEVNHINKNKLDNRLQNLEIVTHTNNIRHSIGLNYEIVYTSEKLKLLQENNKKEKQQKIDEQYLKRIDGLFYKAMKTGIVEDKLLKCTYCCLRFRNNKNKINNNTSNSTEINKKIDLKRYRLMTNFYTKALENLVQKNKEYVYKKIVNKNINLINRYIYRYPYIKKVLKKYRLLDKEFKEELNFEHSNSRNLLLDFYKDIYDSNKYIIRDGDILITVTLKYFFNVNGKYKAFIVLYLLGLLQRRKSISKTNISSRFKVHTPTYVKIPEYTDVLFKEVNRKSKHLLSLNLNKFTYFIVVQKFGAEIADMVYKNEKSKYNYKYGFIAKKDIINFFKTDKEIYTFGFITKEEIFEEIDYINYQRKDNCEEYNKIYGNFINFISSLLLYDTETKQVLEDLNLVYTSLNTKTIDNIKKYQQQQGYNFSLKLKPRMKVIVYKKLLK